MRYSKQVRLGNRTYRTRGQCGAVSIVKLEHSMVDFTIV